MVRCWTLLVFVALVAKTSSQSLDWWQTTVIYQILPKSFKDSDGDGIGDLEGIRQKLPYLKDLGIGTLWIGSVLYKTDRLNQYLDTLSINPVIGTMDDFKALLRDAKLLGLRVIVDFYPNEISDEHLWFQISSNPADPEYEKYKDYFVWKPAKENGDPPNNWDGYWQYHEVRGEYYFHHFGKEQPDLNYANPAVVQATKDFLRYWLELGVDGFKGVDVVYVFEDQTFSDTGSGRPDPFSDQPETFDMVYQWRDLLDEYAALTGSSKLLYFGASYTLSVTQLYQRNGTRNGAHFGVNYFFSYIDKSSTAEDFNNSVRAWTDKAGDYWLQWVLEEGYTGTKRPADIVGADMVDAMNMIILLLPGTATTYYGEEIGMEDTTASTSHPNRAPFQWDDSTSAGFSTNATTWIGVHPNYVTLNVAAQQAAQRSHLKTYKKLVEARNSPVHQLGSTNINYVGNVWGFIRKYESSAYVVLINLGTTDQTVDVLSLFPNAPSSMEVYAVSLDSPYNEGDVLDSSNIHLHSREAVTLHGSISTQV